MKLEDIKAQDRKSNKKEEIKEETNESLSDKFNEELEGYYELIHPVVNIRSKPASSNKDTLVITAFRGSRLYCEGYYTFINGETWMKVRFESKEGYVLKDYLKKL